MVVSAFLRASLAASFLLASSGAGYYYGVYAPGQAAQHESALVLAKTQAYAHKRAAQQRAIAEQHESAAHQAAEQAAAGERYQACLNSASAGHDASWAAECKRIAEKSVAAHADCLSKSKLPQGYCDAAYRARDASPNCVLPVAVATDLDFGLNRARNRCLQEREAALR